MDEYTKTPNFRKDSARTFQRVGLEQKSLGVTHTAFVCLPDTIDPRAPAIENKECSAWPYLSLGVHLNEYFTLGRQCFKVLPWRMNNPQ
jgi:hypothetical protein